MSDAQKKALQNYRARLARKGLTRVEVHVPKKDVAFVREVASALSDPARAERVRAAQPASIYSGMSFKEFLESAPFEGIDLTRSKDTRRDIDL